MYGKGGKRMAEEYTGQSTIENLCEQFLQMEREKDLFRRVKIEEIPIWHYIRYEIYVILLRVIGGYANPNWREKKYQQKQSLALWVDEYIAKSQFLIAPKDVLIFNYPRRVKQGKYYNEVCTDEWLKYFDKSYYVFEEKYAGQIRFRPVQTKNLRYIDLGLYQRIKRKKYSQSASVKELGDVCKYVLNVLETEFGIKFSARDKKTIETLIKSIPILRERYRDYYGYLLDKIQPKIIVLLIAYAKDKMVLSELAKERGIPTAEIQQGHWGRGVVPYNFIGVTGLVTFPEYLLVSGQYEIDTARLPIQKENVYAVGSPELEKQKKYYEKAIKNKKKRKTIITFICSGEPELADAAIELSEKLDSEKYKIYFKLHPSEYTNWKEKYSRLLDATVEVVDGSRHDMYYYMAVSDWLIGIASTVLFEATRFDTNILILRKGWFFNSERLIGTGNATYIDTMDEAVEYIIRDDMPPKPNREYFYCGNSEQLLREAIDDILSKNDY